MRVLVVCSYRDYIKDGIAPFIKEQVNALCALTAKSEDLRGKSRERRAENYEVECEYYLLHGKGIKGYLKEIPALRKKMREYKPDVIHAHYGLSGLLANLATRRVPVVTTYHGNDINDEKLLRYSKWTLRLSAWNIFVNRHMLERVNGEKHENYTLIPCGIDDRLFVPMKKEDCRKQLAESGKWKVESGKPRTESQEPRTKRYVLFPKMFYDEVKDYPLAKTVIDRVNESLKAKSEEPRAKSYEVELVEFAGYTREESVVLMNAVDALIMTSKMEGSPQVIKEAMACGCPIISVDVGDVKERIADVDGCYVVKSREPRELAEALTKALAFEGKTKGREALMEQGLTNEMVAKKIVKIYRGILNR